MPDENEQTRSAYNAGKAREWTESRWASWYLAACDRRGKRSFEPLRLHPDARIANEVEDVYVELREQSRNQMRIGLAHALQCWNQKHYSYEMLRELCWIAAQIRSVESVPVLLQIVKDYRTVLFSGADETIAAADDIISIVAGFAPDIEGRVELVLDDLLFDDNVAPTLAATMAVAISASSHKAFARCFNRYCLLQERAPSGYFSDKDIVAEFAEAVPRMAIEQSIDDLTWKAYLYWIQVGVKTKRYSSDEYVVPRSALVSPDLEGRSDIPDRSWPIRRTANNSAQLKILYEIAANAVKTADVSTSTTPANRSAVDSVYALMGIAN